MLSAFLLLLPYLFTAFFDIIIWHNFNVRQYVLLRQPYRMGGNFIEIERNMPGNNDPRPRQDGDRLSCAFGDLLQLGL